MKKFISLLALAALLITSQAHAVTITQDDTINVWNGNWGDLPSSSDVYGAPNIQNVSFDFTGNSLNSITVQYIFNQIQSSKKFIDNKWVTTYNYEIITPGDWFFSTNSNNDNFNLDTSSWNYVLSTKSSGRGQDDLSSLKDVMTHGEWGFYETNLAYNPNLTSTSYKTGFASSAYGWGARTNHPALANLNGAREIGQVSFSGWWGEDWADGVPTINTVYSATWEFNNFALTPNSYLTYGFALNCANDVLKGRVKVPSPDPSPSPVPEPGTALLLGIGMLGLAAVTRRRKA